MEGYLEVHYLVHFDFLTTSYEMLNSFTDGLTKNDLWKFDFDTLRFQNMALKSVVKPKALSDHSLTKAENFLYLFGGSLSNGKISNLVLAFLL